MKTKLPYFVSSNKSNSSEKQKLKPFWTDYLGELWRLSMVSMQNLRKCLGCHKDDLKAKWIENRKKFDREYQKAKRNYFYAVQCELLNLQSNNPKEFGDTLRI